MANMDLRIREVAEERGLTLIGIAKKLGVYRSNMSAIASGSRGISLKVLRKISRILKCSLDELVGPQKPATIFKNKAAESMLIEVEKENYNGIDKSWVDRLMLAQKIHYKTVKKTT